MQADFQYVVRAGEAKPKDLIKGTGPTDFGVIGFSTTSAPGMTPMQLAAVAKYRNGNVSFTTVQQLNALGYEVVPTPLPRQPLHATVITLYPLPQGEAEILSQAFKGKFANPFAER